MKSISALLTKANSVFELNVLAENNQLNGFYDIPDKIYHEGPGISNSDLTLINRSPYYYINQMCLPKKETPAMAFGRAFHTAILEPDIFEERYFTPGKRPTKKIDKEKYDAQVMENQSKGMEAISGDEIKKIEDMQLNLLSNHLIKFFLENGIKEKACYSFPHEESMLLCKSKADVALPEKGILVDFKTTVDARYDYFSMSAYEYRYYVQAAFYLDVWNMVFDNAFDCFVFVAVEKEPPHDFKIYEASQEMISSGRAMYKKNLEQWYKSTQNKYDGFTTYDHRPMTLDLPAWANRKIMEGI